MPGEAFPFTQRPFQKHRLPGACGENGQRQYTHFVVFVINVDSLMSNLGCFFVTNQLAATIITTPKRLLKGGVVEHSSQKSVIGCTWCVTDLVDLVLLGAICIIAFIDFMFLFKVLISARGDYKSVYDSDSYQTISMKLSAFT